MQLSPAVQEAQFISEDAVTSAVGLLAQYKRRHPAIRFVAWASGSEWGGAVQFWRESGGYGIERIGADSDLVAIGRI